MNKARLETLTDGIIAIVATIMVLELKVPDTTSLDGLISEVPIFVAYISSYILVFLMWFMHHNLFMSAKHLTIKTYLYNALWLFFVTLIPFTNAWVGEGLGSSIHPIVYDVNVLLGTFAYQLLNQQIAKDNPDSGRTASYGQKDRIFLYIGCVASIAVAVFVPIVAIFMMTVILVLMAYRVLTVDMLG
ncbi:TMEM175 family protein [Stomatohabitans albus]|uniref:TMEM175 family protein n=1 Tax=Stomatohabitans albus TaxID=3110766 RepID=UPI00300C5064